MNEIVKEIDRARDNKKVVGIGAQGMLGHTPGTFVINIRSDFILQFSLSRAFLTFKMAF